MPLCNLGYMNKDIDHFVLTENQNEWKLWGQIEPTGFVQSKEETEVGRVIS